MWVRIATNYTCFFFWLSCSRYALLVERFNALKLHGRWVSVFPVTFVAMHIVQRYEQASLFTNNNSKNSSNEMYNNLEDVLKIQFVRNPSTFAHQSLVRVWLFLFSSLSLFFCSSFFRHICSLSFSLCLILPSSSSSSQSHLSLVHHHNRTTNSRARVSSLYSFTHIYGRIFGVWSGQKYSATCYNSRDS